MNIKHRSAWERRLAEILEQDRRDKKRARSHLIAHRITVIPFFGILLWLAAEEAGLTQ